MLSIIIPTLNEEKRLLRLLESIKNQDYTDYEIIVADAGSTDKTLQIAREYNCAVVAGGLPAKGRNEGVKIAKGGLILFLDADVALRHPKFITNALEEFNKRKLGVACFVFTSEGARKIDRFAFFVWNKWILFAQKFFPHGASAFLVKKEIHQSSGGFDEDIRFAEDQSYVASAQKIARFGIIKTEPIIVSTRRFEKDGWVETVIKYILADLYLFFLGPIKSDIFKYKFNHYNDSKK